MEKIAAAEVEGERRRVRERLAAATERALAEVAAHPLRVEGEAARAAREGLASRWIRHWDRWVARRVRSVDDAEREERKRAERQPETRPVDFDPGGDLDVVARELEFGPLDLRIGRATQPARGAVDLVVLRRGRSGAPGLRVIDYKTGGAQRNDDELVSLREAQLPFYAMVLEDASLVGQTAPVESVGLDLVRRVAVVETAVDAAGLARTKRILGALLDRARDGDYALRPHPTSCPILGRGWCDFEEVCRLRVDLGEAPGDEAGAGAGGEP